MSDCTITGITNTSGSICAQCYGGGCSPCYSVSGNVVSGNVTYPTTSGTSSYLQADSHGYMTTTSTGVSIEGRIIDGQWIDKVNSKLREEIKMNGCGVNYDCVAHGYAWGGLNFILVSAGIAGLLLAAALAYRIYKKS